MNLTQPRQRLVLIRVRAMVRLRISDADLLVK